MGVKKISNFKGKSTVRKLGRGGQDFSVIEIATGPSPKNQLTLKNRRELANMNARAVPRSPKIETRAPSVLVPTSAVVIMPENLLQSSSWAGNAIFVMKQNTLHHFNSTIRTLKQKILPGTNSG